jgi:hypothetical protein
MGDGALQRNELGKETFLFFNLPDGHTGIVVNMVLKKKRHV